MFFIVYIYTLALVSELIVSGIHTSALVNEFDTVHFFLSVGYLCAGPASKARASG